MKRALWSALCVALFLTLSGVTVTAQTNPQSGLLVLAKELNGSISRNSLNLGLRTSADCDQTQNLIPDGSQLLSDNFLLDVDSNGVGTFQGLMQVVTPDKRIVLQGWMRGTAGINTRCDQKGVCRSPGRLEGLFEAMVSTAGRGIFRSDLEIKRQIVMLHFLADLNSQAASPLPIYQGRLQGFMTPPPSVAEKVLLLSDKTSYFAGETMTAIIANNADQTIVAFDQKSYCSIVRLQLQTNNQWTDVASCLLASVPRPVNIFAGQKIEVPLRPGSGANAPLPGVYRFVLNFKVGDPSSDSELSVVSATFQINAQPPTLASVAPDKDVYDGQEPVAVRVFNGLEQPVVALDHKTNCSIVYLQKQEVNGWSNVAPCQLRSPTVPVLIEPRKGIDFKLAPADAETRFVPGAYRLEFTYYLADANGRPTGNPITVYSTPITMKSKE